MKLIPLDPKIEGPVVTESSPFMDQRGFFAERFNFEKFKEAGLPTIFTQDNHSRSFSGVLRGLHYQFDPFQGKLVWVARGKIFDVVVDCRPKSPSFLKSAHVILDAEKADHMLWVPEGFAHGFCVLGEKPADVIYKMTSRYNPQGESGLLWNDPGLNINWPLKNPIISERDRNLLSSEEFRRRFEGP